MKLEEAAFVNLVALARVDGLLSSSERSLLERYQEALGVSKTFAGEVLEKETVRALGAGEIKGKPDDRRQVLKMMIRVAYAEEGVADKERRMINRVARSFGVGRIALKGLFLEIERELGIRRKLRVSQWAALATVVVAVIVIALTFKHFSSKTEQRFDETRFDLDTLKTKLGLERSQAEDALRLVRNSQEDISQREAELEDRLTAMEKTGVRERDALKTALTAEQKAQQEKLKDEVERLRKELARVRSLNAVFQEIEKEYDASILLIFTTYDLVLDKQRITRGSMGTGFFVSSAGLLVTNKHVVQPWKFSADDIMYLENGFTIDPASLVMAAWPAGTEVKTVKGELNLDGAYTSAKKKLEMLGTAPDSFEVQVGRLESGMPYQGRFHTHDQGDLALLKAEPAAPVRAIPLATTEGEIKKLDPVMVLGFPSGIHILETTKAETSPSLGEVRKIEKSIMVTAPIVPGNSGGPLMNRKGGVVGVATGIYGEATLGSCIPARHILALLPPAADLIQEAAVHEEGGKYRAALDDLRLAGQRSEDEKEGKIIVEARAGLLKIRDTMVEKAKKVEDEAARKKAFMEILDLFGPHWAEEAAEILKGM